MQSSAAVRVQPGPCQPTTARRAPVSASRQSRIVRIAAQKPTEPAGPREQNGPNKLAVQFFGAVAAAQLAFSGAAVADIPRPVSDVAVDFPGSANDKDAVTRPKPGEAKGLPGGPTAKPPSGPSLPKLPGSDSGKPDVAGAAKDAVKKSPLGAMNVGDVALSFPGQANDKDAVTAPKPGEAKGLPKGPTAQPPSGPSLPKLPGSDAGKPDVAGAAKDAVKKSPLGFMHVGDLAFDLPGSNVKKTDLPEGVQPLGGLPSSTPDVPYNPPSAGDLPNLPSPPNPVEQSQNPLSSVRLPDLGGAADSASNAASKAQTAGSAVSGLTDAAGKAGNAKDNLQKAANEAGLE